MDSVTRIFASDSFHESVSPQPQSIPLRPVAFLWNFFISREAVHCKKGLAVFPSQAGMSLTKLSLGGKKLNYSRPGRVWSVTSRLGTGKRLTLFYSVTAERRYEKERQSVNYMHTAAFSARTKVFSPLHALPLPLSHPPPINAIRGAGLHLFPSPPLTPPEDCDQFLAISAKVEDGLHLGAQKCCS